VSDPGLKQSLLARTRAAHTSAALFLDTSFINRPEIKDY
jgi:hypothetical protein